MNIMKKVIALLLFATISTFFLTQCVNEPKPKKELGVYDDVETLPSKKLPSDVESDNTSIVNVDSVLAANKKIRKKNPQNLPQPTMI